MVAVSHMDTCIVVAVSHMDTCIVVAVSRTHGHLYSGGCYHVNCVVATL